MKNDPANPYITATELCAAMAQRNAEHMAGLGVTLAMEAGLTDHVSTLEEVVELIGRE